MQPFCRAMTFSLVLFTLCVFLMSEASTLILDKGVVSDDSCTVEIVGGEMRDLRANVVDYDGDAEAVVTPENMLEESRLSRAL